MGPQMNWLLELGNFYTLPAAFWFTCFSFLCRNDLVQIGLLRSLFFYQYLLEQLTI